MMENCQTLEDLWKIVTETNKKYFPDNNLMPVLGGGKTNKPKIMFVLINPTKLNISSDPGWQGPRFPFIGRKHHWNVLYKAGLFDKDLIAHMNTEPWSVAFAHKVLHFLEKKEFYLTNIVKWTGHDATLPDAQKIKLFLPLLKKEIEIVKPRYIVAFGLIPFQALVQQKIRLSDYYEESMKIKQLKTYSLKVGTEEIQVIPCYFPVGRGNPKKAIELLKLTNELS